MRQAILLDAAHVAKAGLLERAPGTAVLLLDRRDACVRLGPREDDVARELREHLRPETAADPISLADEEIDATTADTHTARLLGIPPGSPVLRIRQEIYSTVGKPAIYVQGLYRSDRHTLMIRRFR